MTKEYSEDELVEQTAIDVFMQDLDYEHMNCFEEQFPQTLGRDTKADVVLKDRLIKAIDKLNDNLSDEAKKEVVAKLTQDRSRLSLVKANQEVYKLLKDGVKITIKNKKSEYETKTVKVIDFNTPENNDFFLASQLWITGDVYTRRPDLICFVNGIPLVLIELKARGVDLKHAYDDNITDYKDTIPHLFWYNAFIIISNGRGAKVGSLTSGYEHFSEWKKIDDEKEMSIVSMDRMIKGTCEKSRFIDLFENFILFTPFEGKDIKIVAKNHQYLGVNNAVESFKNRKKNKGRLGVFWHTQGSGKSYSMIFFAQKVLRKFEGNFTFLIVTDRQELDGQIYRNFQDAGVVTEKEVQAESGNNLKQLLKEDHRFVFTLIHKFGTAKGTSYPKLSDRDDIIIITDEAHRTQYDTLALNMRTALPNAAFLGFTGTPLIAGEEKTKSVFGEYVSTYNFSASIADHATVPLYYDNRVPEMQIINPELNENIYQAIEDADLDEQQEEKLSVEFARDYHIITRDDRLNAVAEDITNHFINKGYDGKAMVVSIDKFTTVRMYDKVQYYLQKAIEQLKVKLKKAKYEDTQKIKDKIEKLSKIDMAVVISQEQNEIKKFKEQGLDISKHRKRMVTEDLATLFKNPKSDFQIVFVCNMWMTGFDVPSISTIYLDKPMKNHTLMQAIARANRVFKEKPAGFILDYINVFKNLTKALAIYGAPATGNTIDLPIQSKDKLVQTLREQIKEMNKFLKAQGVKRDKIIESKGIEKHKFLDEALSALVVNDEVKKNFLQNAGLATKIFSAILPHKDASQFSQDIALYQDLVKEISSLDPEVDITSVINDIKNVLDKSIVFRGYEAKAVKTKTIDLSKIDFEALIKKYQKKKSNTDVERLKNIISFKLKEMIKRNNHRINYQEEFQRIVNEYNLGSKNIEWYYKELIRLANKLNEEDRRAAVEGLTEEELALFDKLKKPKLTEKEKQQIKNISKTLLHKLQPTKLVLDWRKKQQTRAAVKLEIEKELDKELPESYTPTDFQTKVQEVFQHFYDNYVGDGGIIFDAY